MLEPQEDPSRSAWERRLADHEPAARTVQAEIAPRPRHGAAPVLRWTAAFLIALLAAVLVTASVTARYARAQLLDTDRYVATVAPLATDPQVQAAITDRVTDEIMARLPIEKLAADLAAAVNLPRLQQVIDLITPAVSSWLQSQIHRVVGDVVTSPRFATVWTQVNRSAHQNLEGLLTGQGTALTHASGTDIVVDLGPVLAAVRQELVDRGFSLAARIPDMSIPYTVAQVDQLPEIQRYVRLLNVAATWLPLIALALLGLAVWAAPNRRRGLILGLLLSAVLLAVALAANQVVRDRVAQRATERGPNSAVAIDVYDTVLRFLVTALVTVLVAALLGVLWALLAGPSRPAVLLRRGVNTVVDRLVRPLAGEPWAVRTGEFTRRNFRWLAIVVGVLAAWWLLARPSVATAVWAFVLAAIVVLLLTAARRMPAALTPATAGVAPAADTAPVPDSDSDSAPDAPTVAAPASAFEAEAESEAGTVAEGGKEGGKQGGADAGEEAQVTPPAKRPDETPVDPTDRAVDP